MRAPINFNETEMIARKKISFSMGKILLIKKKIVKRKKAITVKRRLYLGNKVEHIDIQIIKLIPVLVSLGKVVGKVELTMLLLCLAYL
jgi:hypothetical protein